MSNEQRRLAGRYVLESPIGRGGMGEVWRGTDTVLGRQVAIKTIDLRAVHDESGAARFEREARATAGINHPGIVTVHDSGVEDDTAFLVMELLSGPSLAERLREGPLPVAEVVSIGAQVAGPSTRRTRAAWSTATSSRATSPTPTTGGCGCSTSGSPSSATPPGRRRSRPPTPSWGPPSTSRPSRRWAVASTAAPTSTRSAASCTPSSSVTRPSGRDAGGDDDDARHDPVPDVRDLRPDTPDWLAEVVSGLLAKDPTPAQRCRRRAAALATRASLGGAATAVLPVAGAPTTQRLDAGPPPPVVPPVSAPVPVRRGASPLTRVLAAVAVAAVALLLWILLRDDDTDPVTTPTTTPETAEPAPQVDSAADHGEPDPDPHGHPHGHPYPDHREPEPHCRPWR